MIKKSYDIVIVGGGPAGLNAAINSADKDVKVAVFEKDREIGIPVRCAEATSEEALKKYAFIDENSICTPYNKFEFVAPNKTSVEMDAESMRGFVLDRKIFEQSLARKAAQKGVEIFTRAHVLGIENDNHPLVKVLYNGEQLQVNCQLVIAADGIESRSALDFGIDTTLSLKDSEPCYQMTLVNMDIPGDTLQFLFSSEFAPGGYLWIFPKSNNMANVGLGLNGSLKKQASPRELLERFVEANFPQATMVNSTAGGVASAKNLNELVKDNFMVIGDAGRMTNGLTGGGISTALASGKFAGKKAREAILEGDTSVKKLKEFEKYWNKNIGKDYRRFYHLKEAMFKVKDEDFNNLAAKFENVPPEKVTVTKLFTTLLKRKPSLILDVTKVFAGL
ncbi:MAG: NAD(P)/FAD-dependent oxidoreductase [Candidatus Marinimicrobia bacterium]|nr:NAD(P)/FAD-dependent oxidoreductase [Candidatus Neomarinimicrobiota bacterium]